MQPHTKLYRKAYRLDPSDFCGCEVCGASSGSPHHIQRRGMGGTTTPDRIENLASLCQQCHNRHNIEYRKNNRIKNKGQLQIFFEQ